MLGKTPWVDRNLRSIQAALQHAVPPEWLPRFDVSGDVEEYGCGSYGCVMPTNVEGLVCKLTTDLSEAHFVARALTLEPTSGIVEYKKILWVHGQTHRRRPLFVLWRSEAFSVGQWHYTATRRLDPYNKRTADEAYILLEQFRSWAHVVRQYAHPRLRSADVATREAWLTRLWAAYERSEPAQSYIVLAFEHHRGLDRVGIALRSCLYAAQEMSGNPSLYRVGEALTHYLEEGLLLADLHGGNLGLDAEGEVLITDPGHVVEFHPRWATPPQVDAL